MLATAVFFQFPFPGVIENAVFFQFPFPGVIENAVFFHFLFFSVCEVLCFSSSLSLSQFPSSSFPEFPPSPPTFVWEGKENHLGDGGAQQDDQVDSNLGDALKLLKHQLEQSAEKPSPDEANALNASGHNRKLPWWSCKARRAQEDFVIALDEEDSPAGEPGTPFSRERHLNPPERQSIVEPAHILARPKPAAKCMVTKGMKNPKKRKRFQDQCPSHHWAG